MIQTSDWLLLSVHQLIGQSVSQHCACMCAWLVSIIHQSFDDVCYQRVKMAEEDGTFL